jgi:hypothetical protein
MMAHGQQNTNRRVVMPTQVEHKRTCTGVALSYTCADACSVGIAQVIEAVRNTHRREEKHWHKNIIADGEEPSNSNHWHRKKTQRHVRSVPEGKHARVYTVGQRHRQCPDGLHWWVKREPDKHPWQGFHCRLGKLIYMGRTVSTRPCIVAVKVVRSRHGKLGGLQERLATARTAQRFTPQGGTRSWHPICACPRSESLDHHLHDFQRSQAQGARASLQTGCVLPALRSEL